MIAHICIICALHVHIPQDFEIPEITELFHMKPSILETIGKKEKPE